MGGAPCWHAAGRSMEPCAKPCAHCLCRCLAQGMRVCHRLHADGQPCAGTYAAVCSSSNRPSPSLAANTLHDTTKCATGHVRCPCISQRSRSRASCPVPLQQHCCAWPAAPVPGPRLHHLAACRLPVTHVPVATWQAAARAVYVRAVSVSVGRPVLGRAHSRHPATDHVAQDWATCAGAHCTGFQRLQQLLYRLARL